MKNKITNLTENFSKISVRNYRISFAIFFAIGLYFVSVLPLSGQDDNEKTIESIDLELTMKVDYRPEEDIAKSDYPFPLHTNRPPQVKTPPSDQALFYGEIPMKGNPVLFAIEPSNKAGIPSRFFLDQNSDGDFKNDYSQEFKGEGIFGSAISFNLEIKMPDGNNFPVQVWLWTTLDKMQKKKREGFNYYLKGLKEGKLNFCFQNECKQLKIAAGDPSNKENFTFDHVFIDWNSNDNFEPSERLEIDSPIKAHNKIIRLVKISPFADRISIEVEKVKSTENDVRDVISELAKEPIEGNFPPTLGKDITGKEVRFEDFRGKVLLIDFWATWCEPCMEEMPNVRQIYQNYKRSDFDIIGVSLDNDDPAKLLEFLSREKILWRQVCDQKGWDSEILKRWRINGVPETFLIGRDGRIKEIGLVGEELVKAIERELTKEK